MTYNDCARMCFAFNHTTRKCRCLNETICKDGFGITTDKIGTHSKCPFYKPRSDENNNEKMREFLNKSITPYKPIKEQKSEVTNDFSDFIKDTIKLEGDK